MVEIPIHGLRAPRIICYRNVLYVAGSVCMSDGSDGNPKKYLATVWPLDNRFRPVDIGRHIIPATLSDMVNRPNVSTWLRGFQVLPGSGSVELLYEIKENKNDERFIHYTHKVVTTDLVNYDVVHSYTTHNLLFADLVVDGKRISIEAPMERDPNNPSFIWGKYLISVFVDSMPIRPVFDGGVDYSSDKGHLLHSIDTLADGRYQVLLSVRYIQDARNRYQAYVGVTTDFVTYSHLTPIDIPSEHHNREWICYPTWFYNGGERYIVCNGSDFGKDNVPFVFPHPPS